MSVRVLAYVALLYQALIRAQDSSVDFRKKQTCCPSDSMSGRPSS